MTLNHQSTQPTAPDSMALVWTGRVLSALPALFMLLGIVMSIVKPEMIKEGTIKYGYSEHSMRTLIYVELVCGIR